MALRPQDAQTRFADVKGITTNFTKAIDENIITTKI